MDDAAEKFYARMREDAARLERAIYERPPCPECGAEPGIPHRGGCEASARAWAALLDGPSYAGVVEP